MISECDYLHSNKYFILNYFSQTRNKKSTVICHTTANSILIAWLHQWPGYRSPKFMMVGGDVMMVSGVRVYVQGYFHPPPPLSTQMRHTLR